MATEDIKNKSSQEQQMPDKGRRDALKTLATVPVLGALAYGVYKTRKNALQSRNISDVFQVSNKQAVFLEPQKDGKQIRLGIIGFGIRGKQLMRAAGFAEPSWIDEMKALGHSPNSIYRGHKADLFDGGHRIPCVLRWPAGAKPHRVDQTICLTDFYATFAAINNYRLRDSEGEDSYNLLPAIRSEREIAPIREATVHHSIEGQFTIRQGDWKLLLSPSSGGWSAPTPTDTAALALLPPVQLYDMRVDPGERNNMEADHPEVVDRLKNLLIKYIKEGRSTPGVPQRNDGAYPWKQLDWME